MCQSQWVLEVERVIERHRADKDNKNKSLILVPSIIFKIFTAEMSLVDLKDE